MNLINEKKNFILFIIYINHIKNFWKKYYKNRNQNYFFKNAFC